MATGNIVTLFDSDRVAESVTFSLDLATSVGFEGLHDLANYTIQIAVWEFVDKFNLRF